MLSVHLNLRSSYGFVNHKIIISIGGTGPLFEMDTGTLRVLNSVRH